MDPTQLSYPARHSMYGTFTVHTLGWLNWGECRYICHTYMECLSTTFLSRGGNPSHRKLAASGTEASGSSDMLDGRTMVNISWVSTLPTGINSQVPC